MIIGAALPEWGWWLVGAIGTIFCLLLVASVLFFVIRWVLAHNPVSTAIDAAGDVVGGVSGALSDKEKISREAFKPLSNLSDEHAGRVLKSFIAGRSILESLAAALERDEGATTESSAVTTSFGDQ